MVFRDILVHLKSHEDWSPHIDYAIGVARAFDAQLRAMMTFPETSIMRGLTNPDDEMLKRRIADDGVIAGAASQKFKAACAAAGVSGIFDTAEGPGSEIMPWAARLHDLSILEQRHPAGDETGYDSAEETALSAGKPVLLVPRIGRFDPTPEHILVAWNGSHQAASAVYGALPFIQKAKRVTVCSGELRSPLRSSIRVPQIDITTHLRVHCPEVRLETVEIGASQVGAYLLERANELGCGMIVMGAYGRSWFSEFILGGATRHIFSHMTVPIMTGR